MRNKVITYQFEEGEGAQRFARFKVSTLTVGELGKFGKLSRLYQVHLNEIIGGDYAKMTDDEKDDVDPEPIAKSRIWQQWAYTMPCIKVVETSGNGEDWFQSSLAEIGYDTLSGIDSMPLDLFDVLESAARTCNPGVLGPKLKMDPSKSGNISVE